MLTVQAEDPQPEFTLSFFAEEEFPYAVIWFTQGGGMAFGIRLTKQEWGRLVVFLKATLDARQLPKTAVAYAECDLDTNQYRYCERDPDRYRQVVDRRGIIHDLSNIMTDEFREQHRQRAAEYAAHHLVDKMYVRTREAMVTLSREQFTRFRKFCLNQPNAESHGKGGA